jgi:hypothetical protein
MKAEASADSTPAAAKLVAQPMMGPADSTSMPEMTPRAKVRTISLGPIRLQ